MLLVASTHLAPIDLLWSALRSLGPHPGNGLLITPPVLARTRKLDKGLLPVTEPNQAESGGLGLK